MQTNITALFHKNFNPDTRVIVALSGGPDSIALFQLVKNFRVDQAMLPGNLHVCTIDHATRPETMQEVEFVKEQTSGFPLTVFRYEKDDFSERALRNFRYEKFAELYQELDADFLLLGHNLTDRIESFFLNMRRGAALSGMIAMKQLEQSRFNNEMRVMRPLLAYSKKQITDFCHENKYEFIVDPTNDDASISLRNKLRNELLPRLLADDAGHETKFLESMSSLFAQLEAVESEEQSDAPVLMPCEACRHRGAERYYEVAGDYKAWRTSDIVFVLKHIHSYKNITKANLAEIHKFVTHSTSGYKYFNGVYRFIAHGSLYLIKAPQDFRKSSPDKSEALVDAKADADGASGERRYAKPTDKVKGKSRSKYCINAKIPIFWRNFIPVLVVDEKIEKIYESF